MNMTRVLAGIMVLLAPGCMTYNNVQLLDELINEARVPATVDNAVAHRVSPNELHVRLEYDDGRSFLVRWRPLEGHATWEEGSWPLASGDPVPVHRRAPARLSAGLVLTEPRLWLYENGSPRWELWVRKRRAPGTLPALRRLWRALGSFGLIALVPVSVAVDTCTWWVQLGLVLAGVDPILLK